MTSLLFAAAAAALTLTAFNAHADNYLTQTDRLIVKYKDAVPAGKGGARVASVSALRQGTVDRAGQQLGTRLTLLRSISTGAHLFQLSRSVPLAEASALAADLMARDPGVEYAEPDRILTTQVAATDPRYTEQWDLYDITGGIRMPGA